MSTFTLGIDIGGTNIKVALVAKTGEMLDCGIVSTPRERDLATVVTTIVTVCGPLFAKAKDKPNGMGIAAPGVVDLAGDVVITAPNFPLWNHTPLRAALQEALGCPAVLGNDVNAFGVAEHCWGAARGMKNFIAVAVGTGVGGAIFIDGKLHRGAYGGAGELGFTIISPDGREIAGIPGALEAYIGRRGFDDLVASLYPTGEFPTPRRITELADQGEVRARQIHTEVARYLSIAAASWLHILDPEAIIIGGGTLAGASFFLEEFRRQLKLHARSCYTDHIQILPATLGYYAGVRGAAALWFTRPETKNMQ